MEIENKKWEDWIWQEQNVISSSRQLSEYFSKIKEIELK